MFYVDIGDHRIRVDRHTVQIMEGLFQKTYRQLSQYISINDHDQTFSKKFAKLDNNAARIQFLLTILDTAQLATFSPSWTKKDLTNAGSIKASGNKCYQRKDLKQAWAMYNQALLLTPFVDDNGLLAVCFANRSAVLFGMQKYEDCLADIDRAVRHGYPERSMYKLLCRRAKCHQFVETRKFQTCKTLAMESLEKSDLDLSDRKPWKSDLESLAVAMTGTEANISNIPEIRCNGKLSAFSHLATVNESNEFGRYVQAVEDISSGDVVLVEKPFCSVTLPSYYLTHCCLCQKRADCIPYPCRSCADVVYCDESCEELAWTQYHQYECNYILKIKAVDVNMGHLSLRTALKAGYEIIKLAFDKDLGQSGSSHAYENIYGLQGHVDDRSDKDIFWRSVAAIVLARACHSDLWAAGSSNGLTTLATAVLHHMDTFPCNAHEISEMGYNCSEPCKSEPMEIGGGIYRALSMFNHSCDPSVVRTFYNGNTCVMNALSPIAKFEQIYDNYGYLYATDTRNTRQDQLRSQYYFECCCIACVQDWGLYHTLQYDGNITYKCSQCGVMVLPPYGSLCDNCQKPFDKALVDQMLVKAKEGLDGVMAQLFRSQDHSRSRTVDNAKKLQDYSQLVNQLVFRPYKSLNDCQEALKHVYCLMGNIEIRHCK